VLSKSFQKTIEIMDKRINKVIDTHILTPGNNAVYIHNHAIRERLTSIKRESCIGIKLGSPNAKVQRTFWIMGVPNSKTNPDTLQTTSKSRPAVLQNAQKIVMSFCSGCSIAMFHCQKMPEGKL